MTAEESKKSPPSKAKLPNPVFSRDVMKYYTGLKVDDVISNDADRKKQSREKEKSKISVPISMKKEEKESDKWALKEENDKWVDWPPDHCMNPKDGS